MCKVTKIFAIVLALIIGILVISCGWYEAFATETVANTDIFNEEISKPNATNASILPFEEREEEPEPEPEPEPVYETILSEEEIQLIALVTMAEAEGESEEGKRLVIDTILNRMDDPHWPSTVSEVIYQPYQFEAMWNGRVDRCYVMEDICQLVREELQSRTNYEVVFFMAGGYSAYGTPLFQVGNHWFSKY